jgi:hypothetical protein
MEFTMDSFAPINLATCVALVAILCSCVGHGGASGDIALMMIFGLAGYKLILM